MSFRSPPSTLCRRELLVVLAGVPALPRAAAAQGATRIAVLGPSEEPRFSETVAGLKRGLARHGHAEAALQLTARGVRRRDPAAARAAIDEIVTYRPAVLFVIGSELAREARKASASLPIVFITPGDPVAGGIVASLARPGGNMTAMTFEFPELSAKRLEMLKILVPGLRSVLVLHDPADASPRQSLAALRDAAPKLGLVLVEREAAGGEAVARGLATLEQADALLAVPGGATTGRHGEMIAAARRMRRPALFYSRSAAVAGALASYGAGDTNVAEEAARLVDKILKGENAGTLPVERPTKFELVVNLRTARDIGLAVPASVLALADDVIE